MKDPQDLNLLKLSAFLDTFAEDSYGWGQDWDLVLAEAERVEEFLDFYENGSLNSDEKNILMQLIVASYDDRLVKHQIEPELEIRLSILLKSDIEIHSETFQYWMRPHKPESDGWAVTPLLRKIWREYNEDENNGRNTTDKNRNRRRGGV